MKKCIITAAITGSLPTKKMTQHVPITPEEIAVDAKACYEAGASIVHIHARDKEENSTHNLEIFSEVYERIKEACPEIIIQISTGGRAGLGYESRSRALALKPETASLTTGSINFPNAIYENSPDLILSLAKDMEKYNILPECEIFDASMIQPAIDLYDSGVLTGKPYFNFVMGLKNCQPASFSQLNLLLNSIPLGSQWNISGVGKTQIWTTYMGVALGGHVRVGLEDNIFYTRGKLATNSQLVQRARRIIKEYGREVATPNEAREIIGIAR
jgi:3-keto-5-aminohexanoate cleavage enzyme